MPSSERNLDWLRRQFVIALAADDELFKLLVFKGGNALSIAHGIGMRASLDLDYSLATDASSDSRLGSRLREALGHHLERYGLVVFDWTFEPRPKSPRNEQSMVWGGYLAEFKVIEDSVWSNLAGRIEMARKQSWGTTHGGGAQRRFRIELSRSEYCEGAAVRQIEDGFTVRVYTPAMIAVEKLRALCQQMPEYTLSARRVARGRDLYDIYSIVTEADVNLTSPAHLDLLRSVFQAKRVPLSLLRMIKRDMAFHEGGWDEVIASIPPGRPTDFEFYSRFLIDLVQRLESLGIIDAP